MSAQHAPPHLIATLLVLLTAGVLLANLPGGSAERDGRVVWEVLCPAAPLVPGVPRAERCDALPGSARRDGEPLCWWRASERELAALRGVSERVAGALIKLRDHGHRPSSAAVRSLRGVGPATVRALEEQVTDGCRGFEAAR